ncbi:MAG: response regulator [Deltaproteobacteria bacterium]|nr:response regulator [Deltaproteobacteria bacterium]
MAIRILIVDDSPTVVNLLSMMLKRQGFEVATAGDGRDALAFLSKQPADLIITDVNMPNMDGLTLISHIRQQESLKDLPIIVLSTEGAKHDQSEGARRGADVYLVKPVSPEQLVGQVRQLLK